MNFLGNSKELLLVYSNMGQVKLDHAVNILLTPQFYTLKREVLPFKYAFQAKKIAASLFDGYLADAASYDYFVYKDDDAWVFIAYNEEEISRFLQSKGISPALVSKIFFVQQIRASLHSPVLLGEKDVLLVVDHVVVTVPRTALSAIKKTQKIDEALSPKTGVSFKGASHTLLSQEQAITLSAIFLLFAAMYILEGVRHDKAAKKLKSEIKVLLQEYPALQSAYTRKSIAKKYRLIDFKERKKRDIIKKLAGMIFKGVKPAYFKMDDKQFQIRFQCKDAKTTRRLKALAQKEGFSTVKTLTGNIVSIEEKL